MPMNFDHVLLIGFGSPEKRGEVPEFLKIVTRGRNIPEHRIQEVLHHYDSIGGVSPYNRHVIDFQKSLSQALVQNGKPLSVFTGMRNWHPFLKEVISTIHRAGHQRGIAVILSPHRSEASCERYKKNLAEAKDQAGAGEMNYVFIEAWFDHPLFVEAQAEQVRHELRANQLSLAETQVIFTAHSIPVSMQESCRHCHYEKEFQRSVNLIVQKLHCPKWAIAYQSRSGSPAEKWLGPDILELISTCIEKGEKNFLVVPVGFLCDNAEVLYDLDVEVRETVQKEGAEYFRAPTVMGTAQFTALITEKIIQAGEY